MQNNALITQIYKYITQKDKKEKKNLTEVAWLIINASKYAVLLGCH